MTLGDTTGMVALAKTITSGKTVETVAGNEGHETHDTGQG